MTWMAPVAVVAGALFGEGTRVEARMKNGDMVNLSFGHVEDSDGGAWLAFFDDDGMEVLSWKIDSVRALPATRDMEASNG